MVYTGYGRYSLSSLQQHGFNPTIVASNVNVNQSVLNVAQASALQMDGGSQPSAGVAAFVFGQGLSSDGQPAVAPLSAGTAPAYGSGLNALGSAITIVAAQKTQKVAASQKTTVGSGTS